MRISLELKERLLQGPGSVFLFLFPLSIVSLPYFHGLIIFVAAIIGLLFCLLARHQPSVYDKNEGLFYFSVLFIVVVVFFVTLVSGVDKLALKKLGKFLYLLMAIPVYVFYREIKVSYVVFWCGLISASILSAGVALYDVWLSIIDEGIKQRAGGISNPIIFGDLALLLGCMSLTGINWINNRSSWQTILSLSAFFLDCWLVSCLNLEVDGSLSPLLCVFWSGILLIIFHSGK